MKEPVACREEKTDGTSKNPRFVRKEKKRVKQKTRGFVVRKKAQAKNLRFCRKEKGRKKNAFFCRKKGTGRVKNPAVFP